MQAIQFKENQKEIWNKFVAENNSESFLQAWEWGEFQKNIGRKIFRVGVVENSKLLIVALIVKYNLLFGWSYLYCPRGPVINELRISDLLFGEIKKIAKKEGSLFLKIDPPVEINQEYFSNFKKSSSEIQPQNTLILDITKSEEELLKEMKQKTRYNIRLAKKKELQPAKQKKSMH